MKNYTDFEIEPLLTEFGNNLIADIKYEMQNQGLGGSDLEKSLEYNIDGGEITVTAAPYLRWAQKGRGPGGVPRNFIDILETWITKNGIRPATGNITQFANNIKWSIIKNGSSIYRGERPERDVVTRPIEENLDWLEGQIAVDIIKQFQF